jgi:hypothetical protein
MAKSSRERSKAYRERQRVRGLLRKELWVPDTRSPAFVERAHRESLAVAQSPTEADDQAFIDAISKWNNS